MSRHPNSLANLKRGNPGVENPHAKLDDKKVREIKVRLAKKESQVNLAREYGVKPCTINGIAQGRYWTHVQIPKTRISPLQLRKARIEDHDDDYRIKVML
jgi:hypothetical protein